MSACAPRVRRCAALRLRLRKAANADTRPYRRSRDGHPTDALRFPSLVARGGVSRSPSRGRACPPRGDPGARTLFDSQVEIPMLLVAPGDDGFPSPASLGKVSGGARRMGCGKQVWSIVGSRCGFMQCYSRRSNGLYPIRRQRLEMWECRSAKARERPEGTDEGFRRESIGIHQAPLVEFNAWRPRPGRRKRRTAGVQSCTYNFDCLASAKKY